MKVEEMKQPDVSLSGGVVENRFDTLTAHDELDNNSTQVVTSWGDTVNDVSDMHRLGKKQELKRKFGFLAALGFSTIFSATWELVILVLSAYLYNGGFAGTFWTYVGTAIAYGPVVASLAEMESMAPTSGGQYHWVSEFSPPSCQRALSFAAGWMSTLAWLAANASGPFLVTTLVEVMIEVFRPDFAFPAWQYTLIMLGFLFTTVFFNTWGANILPKLQVFSLVGHLLGFFVVMIPLLVMCPKNSAADVFTRFENDGGWSSIGTACVVNQLAVLYCILGSDTVVHISEEVEDAGLVVPRCMWLGYFINVGLGLVILIVMLFCIGPLEDALNAPIPYYQLFDNTGSKGVALTLFVILFFLIYAGNIAGLAAVSRETWAFSRDKGFPFSQWISHIDPTRRIPLNAIFLVIGLSVAICLINIGSTLAFNIVVSLSLLAILSTYTMSIGCIMWKRIQGQDLPPARWSLGRWGLPINICAFVYSCFALVFCCFPPALPVDKTTANWGPVVWAGVIVFAMLVYLVHGRKHYTAPVIFVEGKRIAGMELQST